MVARKKRQSGFRRVDADPPVEEVKGNQQINVVETDFIPPKPAVVP